MITKISEIKVDDIKYYLRLSELTENDEKYINTILKVTIDFIKNYTGIKSEEELDNYQDLVIVVYVLCEDMYDNRSYYVDSTNLNKIVTTILDMHSGDNLL